MASWGCGVVAAQWGFDGVRKRVALLEGFSPVRVRSFAAHRPSATSTVCADADLVPLILGRYLEKTTLTDVLAVSSIWRASAAAAVADANERGLAWWCGDKAPASFTLSSADALHLGRIYSNGGLRLLWSNNLLVPGQPRPTKRLIEHDEMMMLLDHSSGFTTGSIIDAFTEYVITEHVASTYTSAVSIESLADGIFEVTPESVYVPAYVSASLQLGSDAHQVSSAPRLLDPAVRRALQLARHVVWPWNVGNSHWVTFHFDKVVFYLVALDVHRC